MFPNKFRDCIPGLELNLAFAVICALVELKDNTDNALFLLCFQERMHLQW